MTNLIFADVPQWFVRVQRRNEQKNDSIPQQYIAEVNTSVIFYKLYIVGKQRAFCNESINQSCLSDAVSKAQKS